MTYPEIDVETPEEDAAEQATSARPADDDNEPAVDDRDRVVELEDDYR